MKRTLLFLLAAAVGLLALAAPASAHVTVSATDAKQGASDVELTFRVPTEEDQPTVGLTVQLPTDTPIAGVRVQNIPGWTSTTTTVNLKTPITTDDGQITSAVSQVTWKATAGGIPNGEFGAFTLLAAQLPDTGTLTFKALQTYQDGSVVRWIETASPGSSTEPDHPAPTLTLTKGEAATTSSSDSNTTLPTVLSIIALVLAAGAVGLTVLRGRRA